MVDDAKPSIFAYGSEIHLPNVSLRAVIKISLQFQTHSEWVVVKDSHDVSVGGRRRERGERRSKLRISFTI